MLNWLSSDSRVDRNSLDQLSITMVDFERALATIQPSARREGFVTVPDVTWNDVGALRNVRDQLDWSILVSCIKWYHGDDVL